MTRVYPIGTKVITSLGVVGYVQGAPDKNGAIVINSDSLDTPYCVLAEYCTPVNKSYRATYRNLWGEAEAPEEDDE